MKLKDIVKISSGVNVRKDEFVSDGDLKYLTLADFNDSGVLKSKQDRSERLLRLNSRLEQNVLQDDDVLVVAKGKSFWAWRYKKKENEKVLASSLFFVLRIEDHSIDSMSLVMFINSFKIQRYLNSHAMGTSILGIRVQTLGEIDVVIPDRRMVERVWRLSELMDEKTVILKRQLELTEMYKKQLQGRLFD